MDSENQTAEHGIMDLPDDLLAKVLANVPLGKAKVGMQAVAR